MTVSEPGAHGEWASRSRTVSDIPVAQRLVTAGWACAIVCNLLTLLQLLKSNTASWVSQASGSGSQAMGTNHDGLRRVLSASDSDWGWLAGG